MAAHPAAQHILGPIPVVLVSKALNPQARPAITEAPRPDAVDVPERELDRRAQAMVASLCKRELVS